jgi:hypothetical protein
MIKIFKYPPGLQRSTWSCPYDISLLRARLAALDNSDPLFPLLMGFLDSQIVSQAEAQLSSDATQQFAGRLQMCATLKAELANVWRQSHGKK